MASFYIYYPRALRHFNDFVTCLSSVGNSELVEGFILNTYEVKGAEVNAIIRSGDGIIAISATYYRLGFLKLNCAEPIESEKLKEIAEKLWACAFKTSVISLTTFKNGVLGAGYSQSNGSDLISDIKGFSECVIKILDGIGDHNRELFKELESLYKKSPYSNFLKLVQSDRFASLSIYQSRLNQINEGILDLSNIHKEKLDKNLSGQFNNLVTETQYLISLVELTLSFFEKRYNAAIYVKQNRQTRIALVSSVIACIAAIYAIFITYYPPPKHDGINSPTSISRGKCSSGDTSYPTNSAHNSKDSGTAK
jgi:hypothetical protein